VGLGASGPGSKTGRRPLLGPPARLEPALSQRVGGPVYAHSGPSSPQAGEGKMKPGVPRRGVIAGRRASCVYPYPTGRRANTPRAAWGLDRGGARNGPKGATENDAGAARTGTKRTRREAANHPTGLLCPRPGLRPHISLGPPRRRFRWESYPVITAGRVLLFLVPRDTSTLYYASILPLFTQPRRREAKFLARGRRARRRGAEAPLLGRSLPLGGES
jgi:hypothetical protein